MELRRKLGILADAAKYDASCASSGSRGRDSRDGKGLGSVTGTGICHAYTPDGRCVSLLKILLTNWCVYDCAYCVSRSSSNVPRAAFTVDEVVRLTLDFYRRNHIEGLFLSSGIARSPDHTMERLVRVARTLREEHRFRGYIHLKTIPEASPDLIARGRALRRPAELQRRAAARGGPEAPGAAEEPGRDPADPGGDPARPRGGARGGPARGLRPGRAEHADDRGRRRRGRPRGPDPQRRALRRLRLRRVYYSAFSPIPDASASLPGAAPPLRRENRLYQADWLLRFYGFSVGEILAGGEGGMLDLSLDPKLAWALKHRERFPVDPGRASREDLLRVPGLGRRTVDRILRARRLGPVRLADLARLGVHLRRAAPFLVTPDHRPRGLDGTALRRLVAPPRQLELLAHA